MYFILLDLILLLLHFILLLLLLRKLRECIFIFPPLYKLFQINCI